MRDEARYFEGTFFLKERGNFLKIKDTSLFMTKFWGPVLPVTTFMDMDESLKLLCNWYMIAQNGPELLKFEFLYQCSKFLLMF